MKTCGQACTADLWVGGMNVPVVKPEEVGCSPILILENTLKSVSHKHLQWPLSIPDFTAGCGLQWPHCQTPKPMAASQRQSLKAPRLWFAPVVEEHTESICTGVIPPFPSSAAFHYSSFASHLPLSLLFIWAQSLLHQQSHHKSSAGECLFLLIMEALLWEPAGDTPTTLPWAGWTLGSGSKPQTWSCSAFPSSDPKTASNPSKFTPCGVISQPLPVNVNGIKSMWNRWNETCT